VQPHLKLGVEREKVLADLVDQVMRVADLLPDRRKGAEQGVDELPDEEYGDTN